MTGASLPLAPTDRRDGFSAGQRLDKTRHEQ